MTAKEKLEQLKEERNNNSNDEDATENSGIDFNEKHNVIHQHRCCQYCRFGVPDFDGGCSCLHPDRLVEHSTWHVVWLNTELSDVCDAYEERTAENENIYYDGTMV